jgi:hypothetical protein
MLAFDDGAIARVLIAATRLPRDADRIALLRKFCYIAERRPRAIAGSPDAERMRRYRANLRRGGRVRPAPGHPPDRRLPRPKGPSPARWRGGRPRRDRAGRRRCAPLRLTSRTLRQDFSHDDTKEGLSIRVASTGSHQSLHHSFVGPVKSSFVERIGQIPKLLGQTEALFECQTTSAPLPNAADSVRYR